MPSRPRDKRATWLSLAEVCQRQRWAPSQLVRAAQRGLRYRTEPPDVIIDWWDPGISIDVDASTVSWFDGSIEHVVGWTEPRISFERGVTYHPVHIPVPRETSARVEMLLPRARARAASSRPKVSTAALRKVMRAIARAHPPGSARLSKLSEAKLCRLVDRKAGKHVARQQIRDLRDGEFPHLKHLEGRRKKTRRKQLAANLGRQVGK